MKRIMRLSRSRAHEARDVQQEIDLHIELRAKEFEAAGLSPAEARQAALDAFGDRATITAQVSELRHDTVQARRSREWVEELRQDLGVGLRMLRRSPAFTIVAVLTLAVGIGANTAIFSVFRSVLLRPLPYPGAEQLAQVWADHRALGRAEPEWLSPPDFLAWRDQNTTFASMAAYGGWAPDLTGAGDPESLNGLTVTGSFFDVLGARSHAGRLLRPSDDVAGAEPVVVLGHGFWSRRFGGDRSIVGRRITLSGTEWTVIGVLAPGFQAPVAGAEPVVYRAFRRPSNAPCGRGCIVWRAIGRMKPGVTAAAAQSDLQVIASRIAREFPQSNDKVSAWVIPLHEQITGSSRAALVMLSVAVGLVLLIGCVNLANLLLVRSAGRGREIGVRAALGAGRARILRQLLTENLLLAVIGGALGLLLGIAGSSALASLVPATVRRVQEIRADGAVMLFAFVLTGIAALLFGVLPALHAVRAGLTASVRGGRADTGRSASVMRSSLVVTQLSLAVVLLIGAGLLMRSFLEMQRVELGYRAEGVALVSVTFPASRYPQRPQAMAAIDDMLGRLRGSPAIRAAEVTDIAPLSPGDQDMGIIAVGEPPAGDRTPSVWYRAITPGYFDVMGMRLIDGRSFTSDDRADGARVAIVNAETARRLWGARSPVGRLVASGPEPDALRATIVGVVESARHDGPNQPFKLELFLPFAQAPVRNVILVIEPKTSLAAATDAFRSALREVDPLIPTPRLQPIDERVGDAVALPRLYATLLGLFAGAALLLAALGVYGVMAFAVTQRQRELGVRMALGADPSGIQRMILGQSGLLALIGIVAGIVASMLLGEVLSKLLFGVSRFDPSTMIAVPVVLGIVTLVASWVPARRAMRLDPVAVIRAE